MKCQICKKEVDNLGEQEFEAGNNAEIGVSIEMCDKCGEECDGNHTAFQTKYAEIIEGEASEKWADAMSYYADLPSEQ